MNIFSPKSWQAGAILIIALGLVVLGFAGYLAPAVQFVLSPVIGAQKWLAVRYYTVVQIFRTPREIVDLQRENEDLKNEVSGLRSRVIELQQQLNEASILYSLLDFARQNPENEYIASAVIGRDPSPFLQYVIIDKGTDDGVLYGMPAVTAQGLIGRVDAVTASAARVQLITDAGAVLSVRFQSNDTEAVINGSLTGDITVGMIPQDVTLSPGEIVLTSGIGGKYPPNILVGQIVNVIKRENELFQRALLQPAVDFTKLQAILVIKNFKPVEISPLIPTPQP